MTPEPISDEDLAEIRKMWSRNGGMGNPRSEKDYNDFGCRILARHAFRDVNDLLAEVVRLRASLDEIGALIDSWAEGDSHSRVRLVMLPTRIAAILARTGRVKP